MSILTTDSSPAGAHTSATIFFTTIKCDTCGEIFGADRRIDCVWQLRGKPVGETDYRDGGAHELCQKCVDAIEPNLIEP